DDPPPPTPPLAPLPPPPPPIRLSLESSAWAPVEAKPERPSIGQSLLAEAKAAEEKASREPRGDKVADPRALHTAAPAEVAAPAARAATPRRRAHRGQARGNEGAPAHPLRHREPAADPPQARLPADPGRHRGAPARRRPRRLVPRQGPGRHRGSPRRVRGARA